MNLFLNSIQKQEYLVYEIWLPTTRQIPDDIDEYDHMAIDHHTDQQQITPITYSKI